MDGTRAVGATARSRVARTATLGGMIAMSAATLDICLPAIPDIAHAMGASPAASQWLIGLYLAGFGLGQIPLGMLGDRFGRRLTTLVALAGFTLASIAVTVAPSMDVLLLARFVQGVFGASGPVLSRAIARDLAPSGGDAGKLLATLVGIMGLAPLLAPLAGAVLFDLGGWRAPFAAIAVYSGVLLACVAAFVPETRPRQQSTKTPLSAGLAYIAQAEGFLAYACLIGIGQAGYMALLTAGSTALRADFGIGAVGFSVLFALAALALIFGSWTARRTTGARWDNAALGLGCIGAASLALLALALTTAAPLPALWGAVMVYAFGLGIMFPVFTARALAPVGAVAGLGAGVLGTLQILFGVAGSAAASTLSAGHSASLALVMGLAGCLTAAGYVLTRSRPTCPP